MRWLSSWFAFVLLSWPVLAQEAPPVSPGPPTPVVLPGDTTSFSPVLGASSPGEGQGGPLTGNRNFPNFIGFISNPLQNIDPCAPTQIWPMFGSVWTSASPPIPDANFQVLGQGLNVALSERLSFGLNQGGYAWAQIGRTDTTGLLSDLQRAGLLNNRERLEILGNLRREGRLDNLGRSGLLPDLERAGLLRDQVRASILRNLNQAGLLNDRDGSRAGWLNLGGFVQYTLIQDVEEQLLLTAGLRWEAPAGAYDVFQGRGPVYQSPYLTVGKEFGNFHVLATAGYEFPAAGRQADLRGSPPARRPSRIGWAQSRRLTETSLRAAVTRAAPCLH